MWFYNFEACFCAVHVVKLREMNNVELIFEVLAAAFATQLEMTLLFDLGTAATIGTHSELKILDGHLWSNELAHAVITNISEIAESLNNTNPSSPRGLINLSEQLNEAISKASDLLGEESQEVVDVVNTAVESIEDAIEGVDSIDWPET